MVKYYEKLSPEAIVMHLHDQAEFGGKYKDESPRDRISVEEVCDAFKEATRDKVYGRDQFDVVIKRPPSMTITFGPGFCFDESSYDAVYGVGAAMRAVQSATEDQILINIADLFQKRMM